MRVILGCLLLAVAANGQTQYPTLPQLNTGAPALGSGSGVTRFTFFVAGDNRPDKGNDLSPGFAAMIPKMAAASPAPAFVLWGGDTIKGKNASDATIQYPLVVTEFGLLKVPVFNVPGNHELDAKGSGDCNDAPDASGSLLATYQRFMGVPYGVFQYGNSAFIGVDTEETPGSKSMPKGCYNGYVSSTQLAQLQATLAALGSNGGVQNIFLFMHRPVDDDNHHQMKPDKADKNTRYGQKVVAFTSAIKRLNNPKVRIVFASHDHRYYAAPAVAGTPTFLVTGGAGAPLAGCGDGGSGKPGSYYHWLRVTVNGASVSTTVVPLNGLTLCGPPS